MEAKYFSETPVDFQRATQCHTSQDITLQYTKYTMNSLFQINFRILLKGGEVEILWHF
jgi:hypothetical protein